MGSHQCVVAKYITIPTPAHMEGIKNPEGWGLSVKKPNILKDRLMKLN